MGTGAKENEPSSSALFGKTRRAVLGLLYGHPDESFYLRQVIRAVGVGLGATQRELKRLSKAGIVHRVVRGHQVFYQANRGSPIFAELQGLVIKTTGVAEVLRLALAPLGERIAVAFIFGSFVCGEVGRGSDVDLLVVGDVTFGEVVSALSPAQEQIGRELNPVVYPPAEFRRKILSDHHFLRAVASGPKIFLIGDEHALRALTALRRKPKGKNRS